MRERLHFWVVGGDLRQVTLARALAEDGHTVHTYALERGGEPALQAPALAAAAAADCVILPLPAADGAFLNAPLSALRLPLEEVLNALRPGQQLFGGMLSPEVLDLAEERDLTLTDYFAREELAVANTVPGALAVEQRVRTGGDDHSSPPV